MTKSRHIRAPRIRWTPEQEQALRDRYPHERTEDIACDIGAPLAKCYAKASWMGLKKTPEYLASPDAKKLNGTIGAAHRFLKGHVPANKGKKGISYPGMEATQFKPGIQPHNTHEVGAYRITRYGALQRKIGTAKGSNSQRWRGVHELVWIEANGPMPPKHICVFKPGMQTAELEQITADKVECISLAENMRRNTLHRYPKQIVQAIQLTGAINRKINRMEKQHVHE